MCGVKFMVVPTYWFKTRKVIKEAGYKPIFFSYKWQIYENTRSYPRAFAVAAFRQSALIDTSMPNACRLVAFTQDQQLIDRARSYSIADAATNSNLNLQIDEDPVRITQYHHDRIVIEADLKKPAIIVLTDNFHPNWSATANGAMTPVGLVDETFRGIALRQGKPAWS